MDRHIFISVDVETDGPIPGDYSMLSLGAVVVGCPDLRLKLLLRPISERFVPASLAATGIDRGRHAREGAAPVAALERFEAWINWVAREAGRAPVLTGNNAPFDWMFVCWYFHHFLGRNPFGHAAHDIRSHAMGKLGLSWGESSLRRLPAPYRLEAPLSHDPLDDARQQGEVLGRLLA